jgi:hypothetical protein
MYEGITKKDISMLYSIGSSLGDGKLEENQRNAEG